MSVAPNVEFVHFELDTELEKKTNSQSTLLAIVIALLSHPLRNDIAGQTSLLSPFLLLLHQSREVESLESNFTAAIKRLLNRTVSQKKKKLISQESV